MEATKLANTLTSILTPALPFLMTASPSGQLTGDKIPESALAADKSIWQKIYPKTTDRPGLLEAAMHLARNSRDSGAQEAFHDEIRDLLAADAELFENLKKEVIHHFVHHHFDAMNSAPVGAAAQAVH